MPHFNAARILWKAERLAEAAGRAEASATGFASI
jgi:hypothetical protein